MVKGFRQEFEVDLFETFSTVAGASPLAYLPCIVVIVVECEWKNIRSFSASYLHELTYMHYVHNVLHFDFN